MILSEVIDNQHGWGSTPYNRNVEYQGLRVLMKPSTFQRLAVPLSYPHSPEMEQHVKSGGKVASPFLTIRLPVEWTDEGDFSQPAEVTSHEGRNRMASITAAKGDDPIEVHLFFSGDLKRRHITPEMIQHLNAHLIPERKKLPIRGPFFKLIR